MLNLVFKKMLVSFIVMLISYIASLYLCFIFIPPLMGLFSSTFGPVSIFLYLFLPVISPTLFTVFLTGPLKTPKAQFIFYLACWFFIVYSSFIGCVIYIEIIFASAYYPDFSPGLLFLLLFAIFSCHFLIASVLQALKIFFMRLK